MSQAFMTKNSPALAQVGVGLRHPHYEEALDGTSSIDFVEVHAENFFADGGVIQEILTDVAALYPISIHSTSMGLGSAEGINEGYLRKLQRLIERINPIQISDHACFSWSQFQGSAVHAGDLLPIEFTQQSLTVMADNVDRVQQLLGRKILVENLSAYIEFKHADMSETEFLSALVEKTGCGLLVDLNNLLVNAHNFSDQDALTSAKQWLANIPQSAIGEIHLAGYTPAQGDQFIIDDHSQPVSEECWALYRHTQEQLSDLSDSVITLIEWDNELPTWQTLIAQATKAREVLNSVNPVNGVTAHAV